MNHGDSVVAPPPGFRVIASTPTTPLAGFENRDRGVYAHPISPRGSPHRARLGDPRELPLSHLPRRSPTGPWRASDTRRSPRSGSRRPTGAVICALSGGVDSSVTAILLREALGDRVHPILVDHGLMRAHERAQVVEAFAHLGIAVHAVDAADLFLSRLAGVTDPSRSARSSGAPSSTCSRRRRSAIPDARYLAQGTLYPDVIESVSIKGPSAVIKTHHNVGRTARAPRLRADRARPRALQGRGPALGAELGLPREFLARHPFPGPGLAVRIPGEVTPGEGRDAAEGGRDRPRRDPCGRASTTRSRRRSPCCCRSVPWASWATAERTNRDGRARRSDDGLHDRRLVPDARTRSSTRSRAGSSGAVRGINRVVYDITSKPPATIEWE